MTKVKLTVCSVIDELDDAGIVCDTSKTELTCRAVLDACDGGVHLFYTSEENGQKTDTDVYIFPDSARVIRHGAIESDFLFEEKKSTKSLYKIPPYAFDAEIYTKRIRKSEAGGAKELTVIYDMTVGAAKKSVKMKITYLGGSI